MIRKIILTFTWTVIFFFGATFLVGFAGAARLLYLTYSGANPTSEAMYEVTRSFSFVPLVTGPIGFVLGLLGVLPGTRLKKRPRSSKVVPPPLP